MAGSVLLETKFHAPRRRGGVVARPRLDRRLDPARMPALTLVSAPAGFGKTTLLAEWLAGSAGRSARMAWVSLDGRDDDPWVFWTYVIAAARTAVPELGDGASFLLEGSTSSTDAVVTTLLNDLSALAGEVVVVLDDYHVVSSTEIHEAVRFLVEHLPSNVHLVLAARADPPWPLAGLRARGELLELRAADLRFDAQEAATYLNEAMDLALTAEDVDVLEARTEGWITALQLAALSMQGRDDVAGFIASFAGDDRFILDYLVDEDGFGLVEQRERSSVSDQKGAPNAGGTHGSANVVSAFVMRHHDSDRLATPPPTLAKPPKRSGVTARM